MLCLAEIFICAAKSQGFRHIIKILSSRLKSYCHGSHSCFCFSCYLDWPPSCNLLFLHIIAALLQQEPQEDVRGKPWLFLWLPLLQILMICFGRQNEVLLIFIWFGEPKKSLRLEAPPHENSRIYKSWLVVSSTRAIHLVGPFQRWIFCDSVIHLSSVKHWILMKHTCSTKWG